MALAQRQEVAEARCVECVRHRDAKCDEAGQQRHERTEDQLQHGTIECGAVAALGVFGRIARPQRRNERVDALPRVDAHGQHNDWQQRYRRDLACRREASAEPSEQKVAPSSVLRRFHGEEQGERYKERNEWIDNEEMCVLDRERRERVQECCEQPDLAVHELARQQEDKQDRTEVEQPRERAAASIEVVVVVVVAVVPEGHRIEMRRDELVQEKRQGAVHERRLLRPVGSLDVVRAGRRRIGIEVVGDAARSMRVYTDLRQKALVGMQVRVGVPVDVVQAQKRADQQDTDHCCDRQRTTGVGGKRAEIRPWQRARWANLPLRFDDGCGIVQRRGLFAHTVSSSAKRAWMRQERGNHIRAALN